MHKYLVTQLPDYENYNIFKIMLRETVSNSAAAVKYNRESHC